MEKEQRKNEVIRFVVRQILWLLSFGAITFAIALWISPYAGIAICLVAMASSFNFCRYCDRWDKNCECEPMNPLVDARKHSNGDPDTCVVCSSKEHKVCDNFPV